MNRVTLRLLTGITLGLAGLVALSSIAPFAALAQEVGQLPAGAETPIISTRGHFDTETRELIEGVDPTSYRVLGRIPGYLGIDCPPQLVVFIHGFDKKRPGAIVNFNMANDYLAGTVVGFSWDSDTGIKITTNFWDATEIADQNGRKLSQFLIDYARGCPSTGLHLVGHSLGARVAFSTVEALSQRNGPSLDSLQLLAAAVEDDIISRFDLANSVEQVPDIVINYYNKEDSTLGLGEIGAIFDLSLGQHGIRGIQPSNYQEIDVTEGVGSEHGVDDYLKATEDRLRNLIVGSERTPTDTEPVSVEQIHTDQAQLRDRVEVTLMIKAHQPMTAYTATLSTDEGMTILGEKRSVGVNVADGEVTTMNTAISCLVPGEHVIQSTIFSKGMDPVTTETTISCNSSNDGSTTPPSGRSKVADFDTNENGFIDDSEYFDAVDIWLDGEISDSLYFDVTDAWIAQSRVEGSSFSLDSRFAYRIYSLDGQLVERTRCRVGSPQTLAQRTLNRSNVPAGTYIAVVESCQSGRTQTMTVSHMP